MTVDALVESHIALARKMAGNARDIDYQQAFSVAMEGLLQAAQSWDGRVPFTNFAGLQMRWALSHYRERMNADKRGGRVRHLRLEDPIRKDGASTLDLLPDGNSPRPATY